MPLINELLRYSLEFYYYHKFESDIINNNNKSLNSIKRFRAKFQRVIHFVNTFKMVIKKKKITTWDFQDFFSNTVKVM